MVRCSPDRTPGWPGRHSRSGSPPSQTAAAARKPEGGSAEPRLRRRPLSGQNGGMDLGLRGRVSLVTGGSRGLGFAAAQALVADGARVLLSAPHEATASSAAARLAPDAAADVVAWIVADNGAPATPRR